MMPNANNCQTLPRRRAARAWHGAGIMASMLALTACLTGGEERASAPQAANPAPAAAVDAKDIYHAGWIDLNKNGTMDPYENPQAPIDARIADLLGRMTLEEKTCQMATLYGFNRVLKDPLPTPAWSQAVWKDGIANIDEQANGVRGAGKEYALPPSRHAEVINTIQRWFIEQTRLGVPVDFTNEGIRGLDHWGATDFPAQTGVASAWDRELVNRIGHVTGSEGRATGYTNVYSPILDVARDPRWGRTVETYSEDPYLTAQLGVEQIEGIQAENVTSTPKHFAVYSIPKGGRDDAARTDPEATPHTIEDINLAPFRAAFMKAGALGTMASYNDYDATPIVASTSFLIDRLRGMYGFKGYVVSDSGSVKMLWNKHHIAKDYKDAIRLAVLGGLNVCTDFEPPANYILPLRELVREGAIPMQVIDSRVGDVLRVKFIRGLFDKPFVEDPAAADKILRSPDHLATALRASRESLVLLKNENQTLPFPKTLKSILVTGPNAADTRHSYSRYGPNDPATISMLEGIKTLVGKQIDVKYAKGCDFVDKAWPESEILPEPLTDAEKAGIAEAVEMAKGADAIVACVGETDSMFGESNSRTSLDLPALQMELVKALAAVGKPMAVVLINGRPLSINWIQKNVPAVLEAWTPGEFGGQAVAEALFGDINPGGKLPFTFPKTVGQIPYNFPTRPAAQADQVGRPGPNRMGTLIDGPLYPFGFGLSYTTFEYKNLSIAPASIPRAGETTVSLDVTNSGKRSGAEVVQLYLHDETSSVITYEKVLRGFERVELAPGETKTVRFKLGPEELQLLDRQMHWTVEPGAFQLTVGGSSQDARLSGELTVTD